MEETPTELRKRIERYKEYVENFVASANDHKLLQTIRKLNKLPITVAHLQDTGIGKTINALRKFEGHVGKESRDLVQKWKNMVMVEDDNEENDSAYEELSSEETPVKEKTHNSKTSDNYESSKKEKEIRSKEKHDRKHDNHAEHKDRKNDSHQSDKHETSIKEKHKSNKNSSHSSSHSNSSSDKKHKKHEYKERTKEKDNYDKKRKHEETSSSSKRQRYDNSDKEESAQEYVEINNSSHKANASHHSDSDYKKEKSSEKHRHKSHKSDKDSDRKNHQSSRKPSSSEKHSSSSDKHSSSSDKHSSSSKNNSSSKLDNSSSHESSKKKSEKCDRKNDSSHSKSSSKGNKDHKHKHSKSSSSKLKKDANEEGICSTSGASFAEALGMMEPVPTIRTTIKKKSKPSSPVPSTSKSTRPSSTNSNSSEPSLLLESSPPLIPFKLDPLEISISAELPQITTNYKPLPNNYDFENYQSCGMRNDMTEEEALSAVISSKTQRTKVYSGNKTWRYVPSLFNLCVKVLQDNIDSLEYTGGVPYSILKPVLERATADQLFNAEHHNPYLIEDTDELWELICKKIFRGKQPQELESWREMYLRCIDEREAKLRSLTQTIKQSQDLKTIPVRQTKLAYVDSVVKPPRAIARKQAKYGTSNNSNTTNRPLVTPTSRLNAVAAPKNNNAITVPNPVQRINTSSGMLKPKKAPLMQKALAAIKSRFRR